MNLEESNAFVEEMEKTNRKKKNTRIAILVCVVIIAILLIMVEYLRGQDAKTLKMYIDDTQVSIPSNLLIENEGKRYMNMRSFAEMLGYSYGKGEYQSYDENENSCNFSNGYEIVSISADSNVYTKYLKKNDPIYNSEGNEITSNELVVQDEKTGEQIVNIQVASEDNTKETCSIEEPIVNVNGELYISFDELPRVFSVRLDNSNPYRIRVYDLNGMMNSALQLASSMQYTTTSNYYENLTAMVDNMLIVGDGTNYGVVSLINGKEIVSLKYENIVYMQNTQEFFVTAEDSVGIVSSDGKTIIKPTEYDDIANLDELHKLYLVQKNKKYGVINGDGDTIVYPEFDSVGIKNEEEFAKENIRNSSLLFEECIPVTKSGKVGIIDIDGEEKLKCAYDSLGYIANASADSTDDGDNTTTKKTTTYNEEDDDEDEDEEDDDETEETTSDSLKKPVSIDEHDNVLTIPESVGIKGIVVNLNGLYGIFDVQVKRLIVPCACTKIYSKTKSGVTTYYLEYNEQEIELESYLEANGLKSVEDKKTNTQDLDDDSTDVENDQDENEDVEKDEE